MAYGGPPQHHAESHDVFRGQRDVDLEGLLTYYDHGSDHGAEFPPAAREANTFEPDHRVINGCPRRRRRLRRTHFEAGDRVVPIGDQLQIDGVQSRRHSAAVDLRLDVRCRPLG